jgi:hypothetical protein
VFEYEFWIALFIDIVVQGYIDGCEVVILVELIMFFPDPDNLIVLTYIFFGVDGFFDIRGFVFGFS